MKQSKAAYLVFALLGIVILIMLVQVLKFSEKPHPNSNENSSPPPKFKIVSTNITNQPVAVNETVTVAFDRPANNEKLAFEITPQEKVVVLFSPDLTELTFTPLNAWDFNTRYTIKVLTSTQSQDKQFLDKDYEFSFQTEAYGGI